MASGTGPGNRGESPPKTKRSHILRNQRERWTADLPFPASVPTTRPSDALPQTRPPKKRVCLAPNEPIPSQSSEKSFSKTSRQNHTKRVPRTSNPTRAPNHNPSSAPGGAQTLSNGHTIIRKTNVGDILTQLDESYQNRGGPTIPRPRNGAYVHEVAPSGSDRKEAPDPDTKVRKLGKHIWSPTRGPRAQEPTRMGVYLHTRGPSTMETKCRGANQFDYHAYRQAMKPVRKFTYCESCQGKVPNCPVCELKVKLNIPPTERPTAKEMIRKNAEYYANLFTFDEQPKATPKPAKKKREAIQPTAARLSLYPDGKRPDWDTPPEKGPEYTSWDINEAPTQESLWEQPIVPLEPSETKKPLLAAQRPRDKMSEPFLRQRPESNTGKIVCFKCWNYGHISTNCPEGYATNIEEQEMRRLLKPFPLIPAWEVILRVNGVEPMTIEEALERQKLQELKDLPNIENLEGDKDRVIELSTQLPSSQTRPGQIEANTCKNAATLSMITRSLTRNELIGTPSDSGPESGSFDVREAEGGSKPPTPNIPSSNIPSNSFFKPDNARYKQVGKGPEEQRMIKLSPITNIPNEIITTIIRMVLEDEDIPTRKSTSIVYDEESLLQNRNLQLDSIRKINTLWRSICQAELYRSVPMTSLRTLKQFAECVARYPDLSLLVKEVKIYIPFTSVDGWTPSGVPHEKHTTSTSARWLNLIIAACPNLSRLDARFAGVLQTLSHLTKAHTTITHLSLDDLLPRKSDFKNLGKYVNRFPNLQLLHLETSHEHTADWKKMTTGSGDFLNRATLLTSIVFKDFPIHDEFLEKALPNFPSLRSLQIENCPSVSQKGLAKAIMNLETPRIATLVFIGSKEKPKECHTSSDNAHLCEAIADRLGLCLVNLTLKFISVCEKLGSSASNWSQLEKIVIEAPEFQGCEQDTTEAGVQEAMAVSGIFNLRIDSFIFFGER
ncbi:hypothetical protein TWF718_002716 [Orbilia javanica]|uniref:CCHC-type domain-containing protein n=1 Tax=Orbilia javanica TaxID=47235 RepID=A0AAN8MI25_9PEZI